MEEEREKKGGRESQWEGGRAEGREGKREGEREGGREGGRERERKREICVVRDLE